MTITIEKKHVFTILIVLATMLSCNTKHESKESNSNVREVKVEKVETFADKAQGYLNTAIENRFPHEAQNKPQISERRVSVSNDSLYVERFKMKYQNEYGGISNGDILYIYVKTEDGVMYAIEDYSENSNKDFLNCMADVHRRTKKGIYSKELDLNDPLLQYNTAYIYTVAWGKKVSEGF